MTWTINGVDPRTTYGLVVAEVTGWADDVQERYPTIAVPGIAGLVRTALQSEVQPRKLVATGTIIGVGASASARVTDARTKLDGLRALLGKSALTIVMADLPTRQLTADCENIVVTPPSAMSIAERLPVQLFFTCIDPYYYETTVLQIGATTNAVQPLGTGPVKPLLRLAAASVNPVLTLKNSSGAVIGTLGLTVALVAGDILDIDCAARTIVLNGVSRLDLLTSGDFFVLDVVAQGDYAAGSFPSISISVGSYTAFYRKAWR